MLLYSAPFLLFFTAVLLVTRLVPTKWKNSCLLLASCLFYASWGLSSLPILLGVTVAAYFGALLWETKKSTPVYVGSLLLLLGCLCVFKYTQFVVKSLSALLPSPIQGPSLLQPVGISFFTFQAVGYVIDVHRGKYPAERNFGRVALFVAFFPQLLSGPIGRGDAMLAQYACPEKPTWDGLRRGSARMLWGFFLKLVIADRAAILVNQVYSAYESFPGVCTIFATLVYGMEIYCDFAGYSHMAIGAAEILGIRLPENFRQPYFAQSIQEFWRRWHISLSTWFRDYLYIPLGGSRKGKWKTWRNVLLVFLVSGLWHGAGWNFLLWGALHGFYQVFGAWTKPARQRALNRLGVRTDTGSFRCLRMLITFLLVDFAWLFFRAESVSQAFGMLRHAVTALNPLYLVGENWYSMGLNRPNFQLLLVSAAVLLIVDCLEYRGKSVSRWFFRQGALFRGICWAAAILAILLFGVWGSAYDAASFIYFQF